MEESAMRFALILLLTASAWGQVSLAKPPVVAPPSNVPAVHVQTLALASLAPGSTTATMALPTQPTQVCMIHFASSMVGQDMDFTLQPCAGPLVFTLPTLYSVWSKESGLDTITVVWW